ncbi:MAG: glycine cleavage system protein GcvH [Firmicutes bacterium]|nr:glycine cleavage system protein GcvH [Bacillota bacterium]
MTNLNSTAILPCNGLDKSLGQITRQAALELAGKHPEMEIICPVLLQRDKEKYKTSIQEKSFIVLDGCGTRCASKLAGENGIKILHRIYVPDAVKESGKKPGKSIIPDDEALGVSTFIRDKIEEILSEDNNPKQTSDENIPEADWSDGAVEYLELMIDKFILKVPKTGYLFNENDCWVKIRGEYARMGVTDYLQTNAGDIMFVGFPEPGTEISQFDDACEIESVKSVLQLISPVSGKITAINEKLKDQAELANEDPYGEGWMLEIKLTDFEEDKELLIDGSRYYEILKSKASQDNK